MQTKLTIEHLSCYLPYGLKGIYNIKDVVPEYKDEQRHKILSPDSFTFFMLYCKPILRPLSDIDSTKLSSMTYNTVKNHMWLLNQNTIGGKVDILSNNYFVLKELCKYHFDIHGLIDHGLAISVHDVEGGVY